MSNEIIVKAALKRREVFGNLEENLRTIKETVRKLDPHAEVYLFGSAAERRHTYSSDIDVLIITKKEPARVHYELWKAGIKDPFEIHVQPPQNLHLYKRKAKLVRT
jgi:predicted nucleotidyltransferase